jgi:hypothetical protein
MSKIIILAIALFLVLAMIGCQPKAKPIEEKLLLPEAKERIIEYRDRLKYIHVTDWLAAMFIVGVAISIFLTYRSPKTGIPLLIASVGGLIFLRSDQSLAEKEWPYLVMGLFLLVGSVWYFYVTFIDKRAITELANGGKKHKTTDKLVEKIKKKLVKK